jgi:NAD(P)H dehydrogenase (quinone)
MNGHSNKQLDGELDEHVDALRWASRLVFVYPTWFGTQPAILKGWFDRVWVEGVAFRLPRQRGPFRPLLLRPLLGNIRSIDVVTSHGSHKVMNSVQGEPGKRVLLRGIRSLCHWRCRTRWIAFYGNDRASEADRRAFLRNVGAAFRRAAR